MRTGVKMLIPVCWIMLFLFCQRSESSPRSRIIRDVYEELWTKNLNIAYNILKLPFLQNMQDGKLSQKTFDNFMKQDIYYLGEVNRMLKKMSETPGEFQDFFKNRHDSYDKYLQKLMDINKIKEFTDIKPIPAIEKYIKDYREIMEKKEPLLFAVSMYPCARLWPFLAKELKMDPKNPFYYWKESNMCSDPEKHYKNLINQNLQDDMKIEKADDIFKKQLLNEEALFKDVMKN